MVLKQCQPKLFGTHPSCDALAGRAVHQAANAVHLGRVDRLQRLLRIRRQHHYRCCWELVERGLFEPVDRPPLAAHLLTKLSQGPCSSAQQRLGSADMQGCVISFCDQRISVGCLLPLLRTFECRERQARRPDGAPVDGHALLQLLCQAAHLCRACARSVSFEAQATCKILAKDSSRPGLASASSVDCRQPHLSSGAVHNEAAVHHEARALSQRQLNPRLLRQVRLDSLVPGTRARLIVSSETGDQLSPKAAATHDNQGSCASVAPTWPPWPLPGAVPPPPATGPPDATPLSCGHTEMVKHPR